MAAVIGRYRPARPEDLAPWFKPQDWWENDGVVSMISQRHPFLCGYAVAPLLVYRQREGATKCNYASVMANCAGRERPCQHFTIPPCGIGAVARGGSVTSEIETAAALRVDDSLRDLRPGVWQVLELQAAYSHTDLRPFPKSASVETNVFQSYDDFLRAVEARFALRSAQ